MDGSAHLRPLGDERDHYWLVQRMAKATDIDLVAAWQHGRLGSQDWSGIVNRCRSCQWAGGCAHWLDAQSEVGADTPPQCLNAARFAALKEQEDQPQ